MKKTYIFGHKNPDTDSICSAIALSYLKNTLGYNTVPVTLGNINNETSYALDYFKVSAPRYLNDVKLQISDIEYHKNLYVSTSESLFTAYKLMSDNNVSGIPVVDKDKHLVGMITLKAILSRMINDEIRKLHTSYDNILNVLKGTELLRFDEEIVGNVKLASFRSTTVREQMVLDKNDILILADRHSIIEQGITSGVRLIILTGDVFLKDEHLKMAEENKVNIIKTKLSTFYVTNRIYLCNYVNDSFINKNPIFFRTTDYVEEFKKQALRIKHTNYPIVDSKNKCSGVLRMADMDSYESKKVILVDHNESNQSVTGLSEASIIEVIDHHKIGAINSKNPINFRNMAVGSTCTIVYSLYKENKVKLPMDMAGLLLSGILSDTLLLKSPTTTYIDEEVVGELEEYLGIDYKEYGLKMYEKGVDIKGKSVSEIFYTDYKVIDSETSKFGVSQVFTLNIDEINKNKDEFVKLINQIKKDNNFASVTMFVTDIIKEGSYVYFDTDSSSLLEDAFDIKNIEQGSYVDTIVSRKKQIVPRIMDALDK